MIFWDTSAVVALLVEQPMSEQVLELPRRESAVWWGARTECVSAMSRLFREKRLDGAQLASLQHALHSLLAQMIEIQPVAAVRDRAERLLRTHPLRAADAFQLGAALLLCEDRPNGAGFACLDRRLRSAARAEGFTLHPEALP